MFFQSIITILIIFYTQTTQKIFIKLGKLIY